ncbi:MAG: dihydrolipoyl dehydrogenase, partial [Bacteroidales bacterium]|nr:dihydrolipoyl dehydrogenase [Bacteroidales bacterium]
MKNIIVIGSGPGGYVAAIRAAQLGFKVSIIEKSELGGICLNWGCIPTKALLKSAAVFNYMKHSKDYGINIEGEIKPDFNSIIQRSRKIASDMSKGIQYLMKKNNIEVIQGKAALKDKNTIKVTSADGNISEVKADYIILATGARSKDIPAFKQDGQHIVGYREALTLPKLPKTMLIIGSGAIGSEFAYFYNSLGTKVTLVEFLPEIVPLCDKEISKQLSRSFTKSGIKVMTEATVTAVEIKDNICLSTVKSKKGEEIIESEIVLSSVGITPNLEGIGLEELNIELEQGKIKVDDYYKTNVDTIFAIGDIVKGQALAHVASAEAIICVEKIAGLDPQPLNYNNIPECIYCSPEIASVGYSEEKAKAEGIDYKVGKFPYTASGKASAGGNKEGFIKIIIDNKYNEIIGAHFIGDNVTEMIAEIIVARNLEATAHELIKSVHPHPT